MDERRTIRLDKFLVLSVLLFILALSHVSSNLASGNARFDEEFHVSASGDDAIESGFGLFFHSTEYLNIYSQIVDSERWSSAIRFTNVTIPRDATITSASVSLYVHDADHDDVNCDIYGNNVDDSRNFVVGQNILDQSERPRTKSSVGWVDNDLGVGWVQKATLENIIGEITARPGWSAGNAIALLFIARQNPIDKSFRVHSYDYNSEYAPKLEVSWTTEKDVVNIQWWILVLFSCIVASLGTAIYAVHRRRKVERPARKA
ncbi:MAG: hypothetical protein JSV85_05480 [Candidatus Bathyarchaeota archaeon]|nr:MAG: hypothetical protein JSV85_05480 [Candidatus Bathyarchaeota archaeon]